MNTKSKALTVERRSRASCWCYGRRKICRGEIKRIIRIEDRKARRAIALGMPALLGLHFAVPDHMKLSRRGWAFADRLRRLRADGRPIHFVMDSTGLSLFGQGE